MTVFLSPGVKTNEIDFSSYVGQISSCIVGMVGGATRGPINEPTLCTSPSQFVEIFGEPKNSDLGPISALMFLSQGNQLWYVRVAESTLKESSKSFDGAGPGSNQVIKSTISGTVTTPGDVTVSVTATGIEGSPVTVPVAVSFEDTAEIVAGKIKDSLEQNPSLNEFFTIEVQGADIILTANTASANDPEMNISVIGGETGISDALTSTIETQGSAGTTITDIFTVSAKEKGTYGNEIGVEIIPATGKDFKLNIYTKSLLVESIRCSIDESSDVYITKVKSAYIDLLEGESIGTANSVVGTTNIVYLEDGDDGLPIDKSTIIGSGTDGLQAFSNPDDLDINVLCAPGRYEDTVVNMLINIATNRHDCLALIDPPQALSVQEVIDYHNGTLEGEDYPRTALNSTYGALYYPWIKVNNIYTGEDQWIPPSGLVAGVFAYNDRVGHAWFAPAGLNRGLIFPALDLETTLSEGDRDALYGNDNAVNPIINYKKQGIVIWGQRTLQRKDSLTDRVNVRRLVLMMRKSIAISTAYVVFEQNDPLTWRKWIGMVEPWLDSLKNSRALQDYKVVMDEKTVTALDRDAGRMPGRIYFKPIGAAEFIPIDFILTGSGAVFGE